MFLNPATRKKLQDFLAAMPEQTLNVLIQGIEQSRLGGQDDPLANMILFTARQNAQSHNSKMPRVPGPLRLFSIPFEPFLVNETIGAKQAGRIDRGSVLKVWQWLARDLIPHELSHLSEQSKSAVIAGDQEKARKLIEQLRTEAIASINEVTSQFEKHPKDRARIAGQIGGGQALSDAMDIVDILSCEEDLRVLQKRFSSRIHKFDDEEVSWSLNQLEGFCSRHPKMLAHGLSLIMQRLARPSEIVRIAKRCTGTDDALKIEAHPYRVAVELVLYDAKCKVKEICDAIESGENIEQLGVMITSYHDLMHYLRIELEIPSSCSWTKVIVQLRSKLSDRLGSKLEEAPRLIKAALKLGDEESDGPTELDLEAPEYVLRLMNICKLTVGELAINELLSRVRREVEQFVTGMGDATVDYLRSSTASQRDVAQARVDAAVRLTNIVFSDDAAELLRKSGAIARQAAEEGPEYKAVEAG